MKILDIKTDSGIEMINCNQLVKIVHEKNNIIFFLNNNKSLTLQYVNYAKATETLNDIKKFLVSDWVLYNMDCRTQKEE